MHGTHPPFPALMRKFVRRTAPSPLFLAVILFVAAGTLAWPQARLYLAFTAVLSFGGGVWLARRDPGSLRRALALALPARTEALGQGRDGRHADGLDRLAYLDRARYPLSLVGCPPSPEGCRSRPQSSATISSVSRSRRTATLRPRVKIQKERGNRRRPTGLTLTCEHPMYARGRFC